MVKGPCFCTRATTCKTHVVPYRSHIHGDIEWTRQFMRTPSGAKGGDSYGAGFWIRAKDKPDSLMAHLPADAFAAGGDRGAVIVMIPSKDIVIVRTGVTPFGEKGRAALGVWLGEVAAAFPDVAP